MIPADEVVRRDITVKTQKLEYTSDQGQKHSVAVSSNSDDSSMLMYFDFFGDSQRAVVQRGEDGEYVVKEGTFSAPAAPIAIMAVGAFFVCGKWHGSMVGWSK